MPHIKIKIKEKIAQSHNFYIVCGNSDYIVQFEFDEEWENEAVKTARFVWNGQYKDVVFEGDSCDMPIINDASKVTVGVFAGNLRTTTPAVIACRKSILSEFAEPEKPSEDVYTQITTLLNANTESINSLVENKVDKEVGKGLSSNDFTDEEKQKLTGLSNFDATAINNDIAKLKTEKADISNVYTKTETDNIMSTKANFADVYTKNETDGKIAEKIAEIVAEAPKEFDTLKEMSDWLINHENSAAAMNTAIQTNTGEIENCKADLSIANSKITEIETSLGKTNAEIESQEGRISENETAISDITTEMQNKASMTYVNEKIAEVSGKIDEAAVRLSAMVEVSE